jgi:MFS family permease
MASPPTAPVRSTAKRKSVLARNRGFLLLWSGESVSMLGSEITVVALPSLAVVAFGAGAAGVGALVALQWIPFVALAPVMGAFTDRLRRKPLMQIANAARFLILGSLPLAAAAGHLTMAQLYAAALAKGVFDVIFQIAYQAYMPQLLGREDLDGGNVVTQQSRSLALMLGRSAAGALVSLVGAARAVAADAASYLIATATLLAIREKEDPPAPAARGFSATMKDVQAGTRIALRNRLVRSLMLTAMLGNMGSSLTLAMIFVYAHQDLYLSAGQVGLALGVGSAPVLVGAALSQRIITRLGKGRSLVMAEALQAAAFALTPAAALGGRSFAFAVIVITQGISAFTVPVTNVSIMTMVQRATPARAMGRVVGAVLPFVWGANALGPLLGSALAVLTNNTVTFFLAAAMAAAAVGCLVRGAVHQVIDEVPDYLRVKVE